MIPGQEDLRRLETMPEGGAAVLGIFQQAPKVAFILKTLRICQHPLELQEHTGLLHPPPQTPPPCQAGRPAGFAGGKAAQKSEPVEVG